MVSITGINNLLFRQTSFSICADGGFFMFEGLEMQGTKQEKLIVVFYILIFICIAPISGFAWPVPDTGQNLSYVTTFGEDSDYRINPPSYTKLDENGAPVPETATAWAMVKDNVTGLIWEEKNNKDNIQNRSNPHDADNRYTWYDSNPLTNGGNAGTAGNGTDTEDFIKTLNEEAYGGFSDWRLPTIKELLFIVYRDRDILSVNTEVFPETSLLDLYWSATPQIPNNPDTSRAWGVHFGAGDTRIDSKSNSQFVRAVRGTPFSNNFIDNGDGTVTDLSTGLMWQKNGTVTPISLNSAMVYCGNLYTCRL